MIRNFFSTPNVIGQLMLILLFVGGVVYAGAFDGFVVETQASCCCGGETDAVLLSSSSCCDTRTKSCKSSCNEGEAGKCGTDAGYSLCPTKGDEYEYTGQEEYCCDPDYKGNCDT